MKISERDPTDLEEPPAMIVCHCHGITDRQIRQAVQSGARTPRDIGFRCGAGTLCGGCRSTVSEIVQQAELQIRQGHEQREPVATTA